MNVTAEEIYECHFASCKRAYEALPLKHRFWYELDNRERSTWEAVALLVNSKPNLVQLRLESKVAESAAKWWKVEDKVKSIVGSRNIGDSNVMTSVNEVYGLRDFIVQLMKNDE